MVMWFIEKDANIGSGNIVFWCSGCFKLIEYIIFDFKENNVMCDLFSFLLLNTCNKEIIVKK